MKCCNAVAFIKGGKDAPNLTGKVKFYQKQTCVLIVADICGLPTSSSGFFGFHIHQGGNCSGQDFSATGSHYDPFGSPHPRHAGDLPPLLSCNGYAHLSVTTDRFCVCDVIGRTIVIHSDPDDFRSQPAGNAGSKIACGVIQST